MHAHGKMSWLDQLSSQEERFSVLIRAIESARNGIIVTDPARKDNPIIYSNPAFSALTGYLNTEILGHNCRFLQGSNRDQPEVRTLREAIAAEQPITCVLRNYRKDGSLFWNELTVSPVHDGTGKLINFIGVQHDVSARIESERRVSEFYSIVSHELRTPLTSIDGALGAIEDGSTGKTNAATMRLIRIAQENSQRLMKLINNILDWKKLESGMFSIRPENTDVEALVDKALLLLEPLAAEADIHLRKDIASGGSVYCDPDRILQVLSNLLSNAIKFAPPGTEVTVKVLRPAQGVTRFEVVDRGPGVPEAQAHRLFVQFQQLDSSDTRSRGGAGLGLVISKSLIELHAGEIGLSPTAGGGSTFWFQLYKP